MSGSTQAGEILADRYRLDDLLAETRGGSFWHAHDTVLHRPVAVHIMAHDDERAPHLLDAARSVGPIADRRILRVLDADSDGRVCYVVNEWGQGDSLDILLTRDGPLPPRRAAWMVAEVADSLAQAHALGLVHGRLVPENVLIDTHGQVRIIGFAVDAALLGLPSHRVSADVTDLAALLYCALTGKWPGVSSSDMPAAPLAHGQVLRPRQVRAGIPRPLDALCDEVLNPMGATRQTRGDHDLATAAGIGDLLREYVGDLGTVSPAPAQRPAISEPAEDAPEPETAVIGPAAEPQPDPEAGPEPGPEPDPEPTPAPEPPASSTDLPTQAGMPVFHDDTDDVEWLRARSEPSAPPPPLADLPERPLFAPDPPEGEPVRRPRPGAATSPPQPHYWPWESDTGPGHTDSGVWGTGSGSWASDSWGTGGWEADDTGDHVPGRSWIRLAMVVALCSLVLVAAVAAYQLRLGGLGPAPEDEPTATSPGPVQSASPTPFTEVTAKDFDPQGSPPREENPELVPNVLDGDDETTWHTSTYEQDFGPGGLKTGVGLLLDLGAARGVRQVAVAVSGETSLAAYLTQQPPTGVGDLTPAGETSGNGVITINLDEAVSARYVTVWLTSLPTVEGGFRGTISEVQVRG